ncbi:Polynucleotide 5'-hydroxyl-kinase NOL9 [Vitis vinifera]|uniref:Polynucleotide 5'-hydroxyl-kinase NOL9 n=1 Tax=Vitis vinifera TaxID=29760 RepID=A0A438DJ95_VITVI|nr:Polynucleotide 5'-hydroxyl-kinase NOL9 [Vitis vinifera]
MVILVGPRCSIMRQPDLVANGEDDEVPLWDVFFMEFHVRDAILNYWLEDDSPIRLRDVNTIGPMRRRLFVVRRDQLLRSQSLAFEHVSLLLFLMGIPSILHASFVQEIRSGAVLLANETTNIGRRIIPMVVDIDLWYMGEEEEEETEDESDEIMAEVMRSSLNDVTDLSVPATRDSIEALEKIKFEEVNSTDKCIICLEEFATESEVSRMPCSHIYHEDCIIEWLERSHMCPLCRFKMPAISTKPPSPDIYTPEEWSEAAETIAYDSVTSPPPVALVCGAKNCGKTAFSRHLLNILLQRYQKVAYLDTDVGQTEFTPPGFLSLTVIDQLTPDLTIPCLKTPEREYCMLKGSKKPVKTELPLVVNTPGWVKGIGHDILVDVLKYIAPTHVVKINISLEHSGWMRIIKSQ